MRASWDFTVMWEHDELARDLVIIMTCPWTQEQAAAKGWDSPAGWFAQAAWGYASQDDDLGRIAWRACEAAFFTLSASVPS